MRITRTRALIVTGLVAGSMTLAACSAPAAEEEATERAHHRRDRPRRRRLPRRHHDPDRLEPGGRARPPVPAAGRRPTRSTPTPKTVTRPAAGRAASTPASTSTIASGGPAIGFSQPNAQMYADDSIFMATSATTRRSPTRATCRPSVSSRRSRRTRRCIMWDPATYPDVKTSPTSVRRARPSASSPAAPTSTTSSAAAC